MKITRSWTHDETTEELGEAIMDLLAGTPFKFVNDTYDDMIQVRDTDSGRIFYLRLMESV